MQKLHPIGQPTDGITVAATEPPPLRQTYSQRTGLQAGNNFRMPDRCAVVLSQITPHPGNSFAAHIMVGVHDFLDSWNRGDVTAHDNHRLRRVLPHDPAHFANFAHVYDDRRNSHHIVIRRAQFSRMNDSREGKSINVHGAEIFAWIIMMPHER